MESELRSVSGNGVLKEVILEHLPSGRITSRTIEGVFIFAGCISKKYRQVTTAVADGIIASLSAAEYLQS